MYNMQKKIIGKGRSLIYRINVNVTALNYTTRRDVLRLLREAAQLKREKKKKQYHKIKHLMTEQLS
jgi:hypothetical protein